MWQNTSSPRTRETEFRWMFGGMRSRLALVRRLALDFELRRDARGRHTELWIYGEGHVRRWLIPPSRSGALPALRQIAPELKPLPEYDSDCHDALAVWDRGRCVIEAESFSRLQDALDAGTLVMTLVGEQVSGVVRLERTPLSIDGRAQWVLSRAGTRMPKHGAR